MFYTQSIMLSPRFISQSLFYNQCAVCSLHVPYLVTLLQFLSAHPLSSISFSSFQVTVLFPFCNFPTFMYLLLLQNFSGHELKIIVAIVVRSPQSIFYNERNRKPTTLDRVNQQKRCLFRRYVDDVSLLPKLGQLFCFRTRLAYLGFGETATDHFHFQNNET